MICPWSRVGERKPVAQKASLWSAFWMGKTLKIGALGFGACAGGRDARWSRSELPGDRAQFRTGDGKPLSASEPVMCLDEKSVQCLAYNRKTIRMRSGSVQRAYAPENHVQAALVAPKPRRTPKPICGAKARSATAAAGRKRPGFAAVGKARKRRTCRASSSLRERRPVRQGHGQMVQKLPATALTTLPRRHYGVAV